MLEDAAPIMLAPIPGTDDQVAFRYDFLLEGKAGEDGTPGQTVTELENGDLLIEGWAAVFEGVDREGENFTEGAFERGRKAFLENTGALCYHHKPDHLIGKVLDLDKVEGKGLWLKARVDNQPESSPLRWIYNAVKRGSMRGLSVGGRFIRGMTAAGRRIKDVDFTEISVTGVPIHPRTSFAVVAGKALTDITMPKLPKLEDGEEIRAEDELEIKGMIARLDRIFTNIAKRGTGQDTAAAQEVALV